MAAHEPIVTCLQWPQNGSRAPGRFRARPKRPASAGELPPAAAADFSGGEALEGSRLENLDLSCLKLPSLTARESLLQTVSLAGAGIHSLRLRGVRLERCDLSNAVLRAFEAVRVEFIECLQTGIAAAGYRWQDVLLEGCDARYPQLCGGRAARCEFKASRPGESGFREAILEGAIPARADLRGAGIEAIVFRGADVRVAIVTPDRAVELARLPGLVVR